jgi:hypothetical protein
MKGEIDKDFYCSLGRDERKQRDICSNECATCGCEAYHRKYPTPEQYREEYGEEWKGAMYTKCFSDFCKFTDCPYSGWSSDPLPDFAAECDTLTRVCACTPWGKPPDNWRPE